MPYFPEPAAAQLTAGFLLCAWGIWALRLVGGSKSSHSCSAQCCASSQPRAAAQACGIECRRHGGRRYEELRRRAKARTESGSRRSDAELAGLIFHELAHQQFYLPGDTAFNESFARFVELEGLRQWREQRGLPAADGRPERQREQFTSLLLASRGRLEALYAQTLPAPAMRQAKQAEFVRLRHDYRQLRDQQWQGDRRFDAWINAPLNNARLLPIGLYEQWLPAFARLFAQNDGDWPRFYQAVEALAQQPDAVREQQLRDSLAVRP